MRPARVPSASPCGRSTRPPAIACASSSSMKRPASRSPPSTKAAATLVDRGARHKSVDLDGQYLIVEDAELEAIEIESTHTTRAPSARSLSLKPASRLATITPAPRGGVVG